MIKKLEAQVDQFLLGGKCPVSRGIVVQEQDPLGELSDVFSLQNVLHLHQKRLLILPVYSLALWKIVNEEDAVLSQKSKQELLQRIFALGIFWGGVSCYAATPWIVALSPGHSDIIMVTNRARQEIIWIAPKKFQKLFRRLAPLTFLIRVRALRDPLRGELPHVQIFMNDGPNPLT